MNFIERHLESIVRILAGKSLPASLCNETGCEDKSIQWSDQVNTREFRYYFRGEPSCSYSILPKIFRHSSNMLDKENLIRREMIRAFPSVFRSGTATPIEQLVVMQHFGVPTRLLDVTRNLLVALYFACQRTTHDRNADGDGRVLVFGVSKLDPSIYIKGEVFRELEYYNPFVNHIIGDIPDKVGSVPLRETSVVLSSKPQSIANWCVPFILRSAYLSERQRVQSGHFLFFPNKYTEDKFSKEICDEPVPSGCLLIPKESKCMILESLDLFFGINKKNLFPEDVDGGCKDILEDIKKGILL